MLFFKNVMLNTKEKTKATLQLSPFIQKNL